MSSSVLCWPGREAVDAAVRAWAKEVAATHPEIERLGYFGSYARGDQGVGSDVDLVAVVRACDVPFERRGASWDLSALPVPGEILVYTEAEWRKMEAAGSRFARTLARETVWVHLAAG